VDDPVHHFDIFATAAAAAGAPLPDDRMVDGVDLLPFVRGEATGVPHRELFWRSGASRAALVDGWKLSVSDPPGRRWLFDLRADPTEQRDVSAEHPEKVAALKRALAAHDAEQEPSSWLPSISRAITIDKDLTVPEAADDEYIYWSN
jgi:arylsulfatase A-like enzyme